MKAKQVDVRLTRDPRYVEAQARLTTLQTEFNQLDAMYSQAMTGLSQLPSQSDLISDEAAALLNGGQAQAPARAVILKTIEDLHHRRTVIRRAIEMQRAHIEKLTDEVSKQIASELLPRHRENLVGMIDAALKLAEFVDAEQDLFEELHQNGVRWSVVLRPFRLAGITVRDTQSQLSRLLFDAELHGYIKASDLPAILRPHIPSRAKPEQPSGINGHLPSELDWSAE